MKKNYLVKLGIVLLLMGSMLVNALAQDIEADSLALVDIYNAAKDNDTASLDNWLTANPLDTWECVTVDTTGDIRRVSKLSIFSERGFSGVISASVGNLTELTEFKFNDQTGLNGPIPEELWNCTKLTKLQIKLNGGFAGDVVPEGIEALTSLVEINFEKMGLAGNIPSGLFSIPALTKAYLHENSFTGAVPSNLSGATLLTRLYLTNNKLEGPLPFVEFDNNGADTKVKLTGNYFSFADVKPYHDAHTASPYAGFSDDYQLTGDTTDVLTEIGKEVSLTSTVEGGESFAWFKGEETTPVSTGASYTINSVAEADFATYTCKVQNSGITGFEILDVYDLNTDYLKSDSLALVDIYLAAKDNDTTTLENWLTGPLDTWDKVTVENIDGVSRVTKLTISGEDFGFNGVISPSVGKLTALTEFRFNDQAGLKGPIPAEIWNCTKLTKLQIKLNGGFAGDTVPEGIEALTSLVEINFEKMELGGNIPSGLFSIPTLTKAYIHENDFTGPVPANLSGATQLTRLYLTNNKLEGPLPFVEFDNNGADTKVKLTGNHFSFADVKPYHDAHAASPYADLADEYQWAQDTTKVSAAEGEDYTLSVTVEDGEMYSWFKDEETTPISTEADFVLSPLNKLYSGVYLVKVQNADITEFDIRAVFVLEVTDAVSVADNVGTVTRVYPNPMLNQLNIETTSNINAISLLTITGKEIKINYQINNNKAVLNTSTLNKGVYFVKVASENNQVKLFKVVK